MLAKYLFAFSFVIRAEWVQVLSGCLAEPNPDSLLHPMDPIVIRLRGVEAMAASRPSTPQSANTPCFSDYHTTASKGYQRVKKSSEASTTMSGFLLIKSLHLTDGVSIQSALKVEDFENSQGTQQLNNSSTGQVIGKSASSITISQILADGDIYDLHRLKSLQQLRKKNKAQRVRRSLKAFVNKLAPKLHNAIYSRKLENLRRILRGLVVRKKYRKIQRRRLCACIDIQRCYRGYSSRKLNRQRMAAACSIQRVVRGVRDRRVSDELRKIDALVKWMRRKIAGLLLRRVIIRWRQRILAKREKAIKVLQALARKASLERRRKAKRAIRQEQERRAVVIQKSFRGKVSRDAYRRLRKEKALADGLLREKQILSATKIQSTYRGKSGRRAYSKLKDDKQARKLELERAQEAEEKKRNDSAAKIQKFFKQSRSKRNKLDLNRYTRSLHYIYTFICGRKPGSINESPGYVIEVEAGSGETDGVHIGKVIGFNESRNEIRVSFDTEKEGTYYIEDMPFDSASIKWKNAPAAEQRYM